MCANFAHVLCSSNSPSLNTLRMCLRELPGLKGFSAQNIRNMRQFAEFWQAYLIYSPLASKMEVADLQQEIEYDRFSLAKWSPMASEINRDEFLGISFSQNT